MNWGCPSPPSASAFNSSVYLDRKPNSDKVLKMNEEMKKRSSVNFLFQSSNLKKPIAFKVFMVKTQISNRPAIRCAKLEVSNNRNSKQNLYCLLLMASAELATIVVCYLDVYTPTFRTHRFCSLRVSRFAFAVYRDAPRATIYTGHRLTWHRPSSAKTMSPITKGNQRKEVLVTKTRTQSPRKTLIRKQPQRKKVCQR
jgi:hypothetical protein